MAMGPKIGDMFTISLVIPSLGVVVENGSLLMSTSYANVDSLVIASQLQAEVWRLRRW
jgi:hypothetical protein